MKSRWISGVGAVLVVGGLWIASYGTGVMPAAAAPLANNPSNPFQAILDKLDRSRQPSQAAAVPKMGITR